MIGLDRLSLIWFLSYIRLKRSHFAVFRSSRVWYRNIHIECLYWFSTLTSSSSGMCILIGMFVAYVFCAIVGRYDDLKNVCMAAFARYRISWWFLSAPSLELLNLKVCTEGLKFPVGCGGNAVTEIKWRPVCHMLHRGSLWLIITDYVVQLCDASIISLII